LRWLGSVRSQLMLAMRRREEGVQHGVQTGDHHRGQQLYKELKTHLIILVIVFIAFLKGRKKSV
jgi:hypothetical protein